MRFLNLSIESPQYHSSRIWLPLFFFINFECYDQPQTHSFNLVIYRYKSSRKLQDLGHVWLVSYYFHPRLFLDLVRPIGRLSWNGCKKHPLRYHIKSRNKSHRSLHSIFFHSLKGKEIPFIWEFNSLEKAFWMGNLFQ